MSQHHTPEARIRGIRLKGIDVDITLIARPDRPSSTLGGSQIASFATCIEIQHAATRNL